MRYFAIRHKPTGNYMPQSDRTIRAGFTHHEPRHPEAAAPRLFTREQDAKVALTWWLKGVTTADRISHGTNVFGEYDDWGGDFHTRLVTDEDAERYAMVPRRAEDMEVVPVVVTPE